MSNADVLTGILHLHLTAPSNSKSHNIMIASRFQGNSEVMSTGWGNQKGPVHFSGRIVVPIGRRGGRIVGMPGARRIALGGYVYHVLNRANGRLRLFRRRGDFEAFETILAGGVGRFSMRLCGYGLLSNHRHLLVWPRGYGSRVA